MEGRVCGHLHHTTHPPRVILFFGTWPILLLVFSLLLLYLHVLALGVDHGPSGSLPLEFEHPAGVTSQRHPTGGASSSRGNPVSHQPRPEGGLHAGTSIPVPVWNVSLDP